jgi:sugar phosphate permease
VIFSWLLIPYLMLATGLNVAEAGAVLSVASAVAAVMNAAIGRVLDEVEPVLFIALISIVESVAYLVYAYGFLKGVLLLIVSAAVIERLARGFYPVYAVYEYDVYPEEIRERAFALHNLFPYMVQLATYPAIGYVLAVTLDGLTEQIRSLYIFAAASTALGVLALLWLPRVGARRVKVSQPLLKSVSKPLLRAALAAIILGVHLEFCQPLIVANLFISIAGNALLGLALYETFTALPSVIVSPLVLHIGRRRGIHMLALGMTLTAAADVLLGFSYSVCVAFLAAAVAAAGYAFTSPFLMDTLFSIVPREYRGTLFGSLSSVRRLVGIAMPAIAGLVASMNPAYPSWLRLQRLWLV